MECRTIRILFYIRIHKWILIKSFSIYWAICVKLEATNCWYDQMKHEANLLLRIHVTETMRFIYKYYIFNSWNFMMTLFIAWNYLSCMINIIFVTDPSGKIGGGFSLRTILRERVGIRTGVGTMGLHDVLHLRILARRWWDHDRTSVNDCMISSTPFFQSSFIWQKINGLYSRRELEIHIDIIFVIYLFNGYEIWFSPLRSSIKRIPLGLCQI